jgi:LuxR family maltose regulon positive regulatory protein
LQGVPVVRSKLIWPQLPNLFLLSERINKLVRTIRSSRVSTVTAPAGYGKTTLLAAALAGEKPQRCRICWYRLEREDADMAVFYAHLIEALFPGQSADWTEARSNLALYGNIECQHMIVNAIICQEMWAFHERQPDIKTRIVLDDFQHAADTPEIVGAVRYLIDNLPGDCSLIISSRSETGLLAGKRSLRQDTVEVGREDMCFDIAELTDLLHNVYGIATGLDLAQQIMGNTEGWIAGIVIICQALERYTPGETARMIEQAGQKVLLFNYLAVETLKNIDRDMMRFLVKTAILRDFTAAAAESILGEHQAPEPLAQCERQGLFIQKTPGPEAVYSFHPLFREALQQMQPAYLSRAEIADCHLRAAAYYIEQQTYIPAIEHFITSGNVDLAVDLITRESMRLITFEAVDQLRLWFKLLPEPVINANGRLLFIKSYLYTHSRDDLALALLKQALAKFQEQNDLIMQVHCLLPLTHIYALLNDIRSLSRYLNQLPPELKDTDDSYLIKYKSVFDLFRAVYEENFDLGVRLERYVSRLNLDGDWQWMAITYSCILHYLLGDLGTAEAAIKSTLEMDLIQRAEIFRGFSLAFYVIVLSLKNDRQTLPAVLSDLTAIGEKYGYLYLTGLAKRLSAVERYADHDLDSALELIEDSTGDFDQMGNLALPHINRLSRCLWLTRQQDPTGLLAEARAAQKMLSANRTGQCFQEIGLSLLGAVAREAGEYKFAKRCLLSAVAGSRKKKARQVLCSTLLHLAKLYWDTGDAARGREILGQAMEIAAGNSYAAFWDLHLPTLVEMAARCVRERISPSYALELIARYYGKEAAERLAADATATGEASLRAFADSYGTGAAVFTETPRPKIRVCLLGRFRLEIDGRLVPETAWKTRKVAGVFKYLLLHRDQVIARDRLMELFWPDSDQQAASLSLRAALHELRKLLVQYGIPAAGRAALIQSQRGSLVLKTGGRLSLDIDQFISLYNNLHGVMPLTPDASADSSAAVNEINGRIDREQMVSLYRGNLLDGDEYFDWIFPVREEMMSRFIEVAVSLAAVYMNQGEYDRAEGLLQKALTAGSCNEEVCFCLIKLYATTNRRDRAAKLYADFARRLQEELGIQPDPKLARAVSGVEH